MDLYMQSSALLMRIRDQTWQAAIDGDAERHERLERVFDKVLKRHERRERAIRPQ